MAKDWEEWKKDFIYKENMDLQKEIIVWELLIESPIERIAWVSITNEFEFLWKKGIVVIERQKPIGKYFADIYMEYSTDAGTLKVVIECDGHEYHERTKEQASHDKQRDRYMTIAGYTVLRYSGSDILKDHNQISKDLYELFISPDRR